MHVQETACREVYLSSIYFEDGSKPGLNQALLLLSCKDQHNSPCIYILQVYYTIYECEKQPIHPALSRWS